MTAPGGERATDAPVAYLIHRTRGRIRLRVPGLRYDDEGLARLSADLGRLAGVRGVRTDARTATALLSVDPTPAGDPLGRVAASGLLTLSPLRPPLSPGLSALRRASDRADQGIATLTGGLGDLRTLLVLALVVLALRQWSRGQVMIPAMSLLMYALDLVRFERPDTH
jgi:hypothetical protein